MNTYFLITSLGFYLTSTLFYLLYLITGRKKLGKPAHMTLLGGISLHVISLLFRYIQAGYPPIINFHEALSFLSLSIAVFFLYLRRLYRIELVGCIILPVISIMLICALTLPTSIKPIPPVLKSYWLPIHTIFCFAGNAVFFVGFFISLLYLIVERNIKRKSRLSLSHRLPSLETLDSINYKCMSYGFPLLTVGIVTGSIWAGLAWGSHWSWDPKETWSLITWILYAILLHNRLTMGWQGRKTAYMMIIGFFSLIFTFLGVNLFLGGLHSYLS
jgi:cytochrome c-type biogenesis protein CcsB